MGAARMRAGRAAMPVGLAAAVLAATACGASNSDPEQSDSGRAQLQGGGAFAADKGPAHTTPLPAPGEQAWVYLDGEDTWRYVAPDNPGRMADGRAYRVLAQPPCTGCNVVGIAHGNGMYLAADPETLFTSMDGETWQAHNWERATLAAGTPEDELGEGKIARIDFTGGYFTLHTADGNTSLSADGVTWTAQLKIPLGQIGPAACNGRCVVAGGRLFAAPVPTRTFNGLDARCLLAMKRLRPLAPTRAQLRRA
jgi:hypothetical protein